MKKRVQVILNDESWPLVEKLSKSANEGFEGGSITFSDVINEMVISSNVNIEKLQIKHTNIRKSLRALASQKDLDVDEAIKSLLALKKGKKAVVRKNLTETENKQCVNQ